jgi:hypothetical protein
MMQADTVIPQPLRVKSEPYWRAWEMIAEDGNILDRDLRTAGWNFFFLAATIQATVWGHRTEKNVRRAMKRVLAEAKLLTFNCLEVTEVSAKRFLGLPYLRVSAHSRHIQKSPFLQSHAERSRAELAAAWAVG